MKESPLFWPAHFRRDILFVLDETALPERFHYLPVRSVSQAVKVVKEMKTRAFGQFLVVLSTFLILLRTKKNLSDAQLLRVLQKAARALNNSRPTFPFEEVTGMVLGWAQKAIAQNQPLKPFLEKAITGFLEGIRQRRLKRVQDIADVLKTGDRVLTHCNVSGELAMAYQLCQAQKKDVVFYATETRPYFQGAKLTCWELKRAGAQVTLVADNAVGYLMNQRLVNVVIVGSDRSCANGDIANKIGTYQIAVLAQEFGIPFYALTQPSNRIPRGQDIPIEIRDAKEFLSGYPRSQISKAVKGFYPAFDVVERELMTKAIAIDVH